MRYYTFPRVFPHAGIHISTRGNPRKIMYSCTNFTKLHEIHESTCKLTCRNSLSRSNFRMWKYTKKWVWEIHNFWCVSTCRNAQSHVNFHMGKSVFLPVWIYTYFCVFPHAVISLKTLQIRVRGNTLFLMWEFTLNCVSLHAVIHQNLCKSAQRIYTVLGAFPRVEIHKYPHMRQIKF